MKRKWIGMLLMAAVLVQLGGCGKSADSGETAQKEDAKSKVDINVCTWYSGGEKDACDAVIEKFEKEHPDININMNYIPYDDYVSKLSTMISADETPDVFYVQETEAKEWGLKGIAMDLKPLYEKDGINPEETFVEAALYQTDDNLWALSPSIATIVMYYNKDIFKENGITPPSDDPSQPWTWEEYVETAQKLTKDVNGKTPLDEGFDYNSVATYGTLMTTATSQLSLTPLLFTNDASFVSEDGKELGINKPEAVEVLQNVADLSAVDKCAPTIGMSKGLQSSSAMLMNGQLGMFIDGSYIYPEFKNEKYDVGVTSVPMFKKPAGMAWASAFMMSKKTKHQDEAFEVFKALTDYNYQIEAAAEKGVTPSNLPNMNSFYGSDENIEKWSQYYDEGFANVASGLLTEVAKPNESTYVKNYISIVLQTILPQMDKLWLGEVTAEEAVQGLDEKCKDYLEGTW